MKLYIVSAENWKHGVKPVSALCTRKKAVFLHRRNTEILRWIRTRFPTLPGENIDHETPARLMLLSDFASDGTKNCTFFGLTLDTSPTDIFKAALIQTAFYYYFHASRLFEIDSLRMVTVAGPLFGLDSLCHIMAHVFKSSVIRLDPEEQKPVIDALISGSPSTSGHVLQELDYSTANARTLFEPIRESSDHFGKAFLHYLKVWDAVSSDVHARKLQDLSGHERS